MYIENIYRNKNNIYLFILNNTFHKLTNAKIVLYIIKIFTNFAKFNRTFSSGILSVADAKGSRKVT